MDPWTIIDSLARRGRITDEQLVEARRLVRSAANAGLGSPRHAVGSDLLERLWRGQSAHDALGAIEDRVAIEHNRTLIERGRGHQGRAHLVAVPA